MLLMQIQKLTMDCQKGQTDHKMEIQVGPDNVQADEAAVLSQGRIKLEPESKLPLCSDSVASSTSGLTLATTMPKTDIRGNLKSHLNQADYTYHNDSDSPTFNISDDIKRWVVSASKILSLVKHEDGYRKEFNDAEIINRGETFHNVRKGKNEVGPSDIYSCKISSSLCDSQEKSSDSLATKHAPAKFKPYACTAHQSTLKAERRMCDVCGKGFTAAKNLKVHQRTHTGVKPYKCTVCGKEFARKGTLAIHQRIHTGEKPYKCTVCGKEFNQGGDLTSHLRIHTGEKPYKCTVCDKWFAVIGSLYRHQSTHTGAKLYKCTVCGKGFNQSSDLTRHGRIHTEERPYKCTICGKGFNRVDNASNHKRVHKAEEV